jgi:RND family efflux transporter MFP subunit
MHRTLGTIAARMAVMLAACTCCMFEAAKAQSVINRLGSSADKIGVIEPINNTEVATSEVGIVREIYVKLGDFIEAGTPIGRLDHEQQNVQLREAELEAAAIGTVETARREVEFNTRRVEETSKMVAAGKGSPRELERYQLELNIALAKLRSQEEAKEISKARLDKARLLFRERTVQSPHAGTVVEIYRDVGEYIAGNAPMLVRLIDTTKLRARFLLSSDAAERFRKMKSVDVRLAGHQVVQAKIEFIAPFENAEGHVIEMTVLIDNADGMIRTSSCELVLP